MGGGPPPGQPFGGGGAHQDPHRRQQAVLAAGGVCLGSVFVVCLCAALFGVANVEMTEYALNYSLLTRRVENKTYGPGRYFIGPFNYFVRFPSTVTTIAFADSAMQLDLAPGERGERQLRSRTKDGLDVHIELSFQYQLMRDGLFELYTLFGGWPDYHNVFVRLAIDRLTESATLFSSPQFFTERTAIGHQMEKQLLEDFTAKLFSTVFSFQLRTVDLPKLFEDAIQETEVKKQDVRVAEAEQNSTRVSLQTQLMQAQRRTKVKANKASGFAQSVMLENKADIQQFTATQEKAADSYAAVMGQLDSNQQDLLDYMKVRALRDHPSEKSLIGLNMPHGSAGPV